MYFNRFVFEKTAMETEYGKRIYHELLENGFSPELGARQERANSDPHELFAEGKRTLLFGARRISRFETCRPSADYQLPIFSGCPGMCEYCYLMTRTGERSHVKVNTDIDTIFRMVQKYISEKQKETVFELSASSDPLPFEPFTGIVSEVIERFAALEFGRLRICTKFEPEESILSARHNGHTDFRFSMNTPTVIRAFEHATPSLAKRINAAENVVKSGFRMGVMIAPVFLYDGWQKEYADMLDFIAEKVGEHIATIEIVSHRYTPRAKETIARIFPESSLDMDDYNRKFKMGQFGYGKYVYTAEQMDAMKAFFKAEIAKRFPSAKLLYIV